MRSIRLSQSLSVAVTLSLMLLIASVFGLGVAIRHGVVVPPTLDVQYHMIHVAAYRTHYPDCPPHTLWPPQSVLEGEITLRENNNEKIFKPGEGWSDTPDQVHAAGNAGAAKASLAVAFLLPKGQQLTTVQAAAPAAAPAALPQTGAADPRALIRWLVLVAVTGVIVGGWLIWRWRRQHG